ncbi:GNAT family N-acetyltransferase [Butyrivibrio proteoclasticus]|uniref:GNAT family N-acetyltransferase n=1 Tax=Butyrivibrio proteoclasticus TaxID=43305 RepID=UPI00047AEF83|nr:GNAT family protein [Butyrivibrio proteoclasticus]
MTVLETDRLILRGWLDSDADSLFKYAQDERIGLNVGWEPHKNAAYSRAVIRTILSTKESYAICLKGNGNEPIGSVDLTFADRSVKELSQNEAELGFWVGVPFWDQGYATEAVREMLRYGFEDLELTTIYCGFFTGNHKSERVQEKCGFKYHHTNESVYITMLNENRQEQVNFLTREDWRTQKSHNF